MAAETQNTIQYSMRYKKPLLAELRALAKKNHGTVSGTVHWLLEESLEKLKADKAS